MAGRFNYAALTNALAPLGPAQMTAINAFWDQRVGESAADAGSFPVYTDRPRGHLITAEDTDSTYLRGLSGWRMIWSPDVVGTVTAEAGNTIGAATDLVRRNGMVNLVLNVTRGSNFASNTAIATIPAGFRPAGNVGSAFALGSASTGWVQVNAAGEVRIFFLSTASNSAYINLSYRVA